MIRRTTLALATLTILSSIGTNADARNLFNRQAESERIVEMMPPTARLGSYGPAQRMPYQAAQKSPYQAAQKGAYQKGVPATCVRYVQHRVHRKTCCDCGASYQTVLTVVDPKSCCPIDVPVCVPACCTDLPQCSGRDGILGRGITKFSWCCGYSVRVVVGHRGDVTVHYYGT